MTDVTEIADGIYRISTFVPEVGPTGFTFNQFLVDADEPLLFHTGARGMFPLVSEAIATVTPVERLRWIMFGHFEADECGAMNQFLAAAPNAQVAHGALGCMVSIDDQADRAPRPLAPDEVIDLGGKRIRNLDTPHVPHGWDAHAIIEETTNTLFCGDLMSQVGQGPAITGDDLLGAAAQAEDMFQSTCLTPQTGRSIRAMADLAPARLAIMHGSSFEGDCAAALQGLADDYDRRLQAGTEQSISASLGGVEPSEHDHPEWVDVVVIGAGVSGIGTAWHLQDAVPELTFTVLEGRDAIGGTWDLFRFPGVRSDSDVQTYAYAFKPWTSSETLASGDAILRYLDETVDEYGLREHLRLGHRVRRIEWSSEQSCWTVDAERTDIATGTTEPVRLRCSWVVATTGYYRYDHGHTPDFAGLDRYTGEFVHAQECPSDLEVAGKRVAVIGSGATAATVIPALAERGAHVTMVQRSPSYYASLPRQDPIAAVFGKYLPPSRAQRWTRAKNQATVALFYRLCQWQPDVMKRVLVHDVARRLPDGFDVARHFTPSYGPWDQRVCIVPGGDLFQAISAGDVDVVTGEIETFTEHGLRIATGEEIDADVVIAATGLEVLALGNVEVVVDGQVMPPGARLVYKSVMLSDVPNLAYVFGYANASWTLKVDLAATWIARAIAHMRRTGATRVVAAAPVDDMPTRPMLDLASGYITRSEGRFPRQGTGAWSVPSYRTDERRLTKDPIDDGILKFAYAPVREPTVTR